MNQFISFLAPTGFFFLLTILGGCRDNPYSPFATFDDAEVEVQLDTVVQVGDREVELYGRLIKPLDGPVDLLGFTLSMNRDIDYLEDPQVFSDTLFEGGIFRARIDGLVHNDTIYAQAFGAGGANGDYHDLSEIYPFVIAPIGPPEVPCTLTTNTLTYNEIEYALTGASRGEIYARFGDYGIELSVFNAGLRVGIDFKGPPRNGVYTVTSFSQFSNNVDERLVIGRVSQGLEEGSLTPGGRVYISELPNGRLQIDLCDLTANFGGFNSTLKGKAILN